MRGTLWLSCLALFLAPAISSCAPAAALFSAPTFSFVAEGSGLEQLEPPGVGSGEAVFVMNLIATNPNPVGLRLAGLDFDLAINERRVASSSFRGEVELPAGGSSSMTLEVRVPLRAGAPLLGDLVRLIEGAATRYELSGTVTADAYGSRQRLPRAVLASGEVRQPLTLALPEIRIDSAASGVRDLSVNRAVLEVGLELVNRGPLGYLVEVPDVALVVAGTRVAAGGVVSEPVPPFARSRTSLVFEVDLLAVAPLVASQFAALAAGGSLEVAVTGRPRLEVPGITTREFPRDHLAQGLLR